MSLRMWFNYKDISEEETSILKEKYKSMSKEKLIKQLIDKEMQLQGCIEKVDEVSETNRKLDIYKLIVIGGGISLIPTIGLLILEFNK